MAQLTISEKKNSLAARFPEIAAQWHPTKNGTLSPETVSSGSKLKAWWRCSVNPEHEWDATIGSRTGKTKPGCAQCDGKRVSKTNSLAARFPDVAAEWHPTRNAPLTPNDVVGGSHKKVWWQCKKNPEHEWDAVIGSRTGKGTRRGCRICDNRTLSNTNSLAVRFPEIAAQWHLTKNGTLTPDKVLPRSPRKAWWQCNVDSEHEWDATIASRTANARCPYCSNKRVHAKNSLAARFPDIAEQWHRTKNGTLTPDQVVGRSHVMAWWQCEVDEEHEWMATVNSQTGRGRKPCPFCNGKKVCRTNSLAGRFPEIAIEWHPTKNGALTPDQVVAGSNKKVWWQCTANPEHQWHATIGGRTGKDKTGCRICNSGWTIDAIRIFVASLTEHLPTFTPAELYLIFQQSRLWNITGKGRELIRALAVGKLPKQEIERFVNQEPSLVDRFLISSDQSEEEEEIENDNVQASSIALGPDEQLACDYEHVADTLPIVETKDVLNSLQTGAVTAADEEAIAFLLSSAVNKLWRHAYQDELVAVEQARSFHGTKYSQLVRSTFLSQYEAAKHFVVPSGYSFKVNGKLTEPNLMQRHFANMASSRKRVGNWSGTGAGKTLSAVLATQVLPRSCTVICCPNSVVNGWTREILSIFPHSDVASRTFSPFWLSEKAHAGHKYLVLNYEAFQQPDSSNKIRELVSRTNIDFIIVDEIHFAKQRGEDVSLRRQRVNELVSLSGEKNSELNVLGMSATPVINNLQEGRSMVELITGLVYEDLDTQPTVRNCMALHQRLVTLGIRWMPQYDLKYKQIEQPVDCSEYVQEIRSLGASGTPLALEQILTKARLKVIRENVAPKTLIYTHHITGIDKILRTALQTDGWKVGFFYGEDKSGLQGFIDGDVDVLIATSAIATGVDGLQRICNRMIVNDLPWTAAEFEQLKGRLFRQGQSQDSVTMIIPITYADISGVRWSWCQSKMQRLEFEKSIADAAVDGVVPDGHLRTPAQAYKDIMAWLERLESGCVEEVCRQKIEVHIPAQTESKPIRKYGDFSKLNQTWNGSLSGHTQERLRKDSKEWEHYHALYRDLRKDWAVIPYQEMIDWYTKRHDADLIIGDFGCGEAQIAEALSQYHTVYSFDHVGVNETVVAGDMSHTGLDPETLDVAIFSLSLMGHNFSDYLTEAHRTLRLDGKLHIIEATSRFSNRDQFCADLKTLGFDIVAVEDLWKFTHIRALKSDRKPLASVKLSF